MRLRGNWDFDRVPSKNERRIAILLGSIIFLFSALVLFSGVMLSLEGKVKLSGYWFYLIIFLVSCWVLIRAIFGTASKPGANAIIVLGSLFIIGGLLLIVLVFFNSANTLGIGMVGIVGGATIFLQGWQKRKSLNN